MHVKMIKVTMSISRCIRDSFACDNKKINQHIIFCMYCVRQIICRQFKSINAKEKLSRDVILVFCAENDLQEILSLDPYNKQAFCS